MAKRLSRNELAQLRSAALFAGRQQHLQSFQNNLNLELDHPMRKLVWAVTGQGGIGKTTLLRRYQSLVTDMGYATAWVDEFTEANIVAVMGTIADQLTRQGLNLHSFSERQKVYLQRTNEIELDPERPSGFASAFGQATGKLGLELVKQLPIAGNLAIGLLGEEWLINKSGEIANFVARKVTNKDEVQLVLQPIDVLTPLFVRDVTEVSNNRRIALFFDCYEFTQSYLDLWLREILLSKYDDLSPQVLIVIASRNELGESWLSDYIAPFIEMDRLEPFTDLEVNEYLHGRGIVDQASIEYAKEVSAGLPLVLALLWKGIPQDKLQPSDPTGHAVNRYLKWVNDNQLRDAIIASAVPRSFDKDLLSLLIGVEQTEKYFDQIKMQPFVSYQYGLGWVYHAVVRAHMMRQLMQESPKQWKNLCQRLQKFYVIERDNLGLELGQGLRNRRWQQANIFWLYSRLLDGRESALPDWVSCMLDTSRPGAPADYARELGETLRDVGEFLQQENLKHLGIKAIEGVEAWNRQEMEQSLEMLESFVDYSKSLPIEKQVHALLLHCLAMMQLNKLDSALSDISSALLLQPQSVDLIVVHSGLLFISGNIREALTGFGQLFELISQKGTSIVEKTLLDNDSWNKTIHTLSEAIKLTGESFSEVVQSSGFEEFLGEKVSLAQDQSDNPTIEEWLIQAFKGQNTFPLSDDSNKNDNGTFSQVIAGKTPIIELFKGMPQPIPNQFMNTELLLSAMLNFKKFHFDKAYEAFSDVIDKGQFSSGLPTYPEVLLFRATTLMFLDRPKDAHKDLNLAIKFDKKSSILYHLRGVCLLWLGRSKQATMDFYRALKFDTKYSTYYFWNGVALWHQGFLDEALTSWSTLFATENNTNSSAYDRLLYKIVVDAITDDNNEATEKWKQWGNYHDRDEVGKTFLILAPVSHLFGGTILSEFLIKIREHMSVYKLIV